MKRFFIFIGNYGSGKTELAINFALEKVKKEPTTLVDLDIVNPYFRSSGKRGMLEEAGIKVVAPLYANTSVDVPALPAEIQSVFIDSSSCVIFDVGGDPVGAVALGSYYPRFKELAPEQLQVLFVINVMRPLSGTTDAILELMERIETSSRLKVTGLINNSNLANEASSEDIKLGYGIVKEVSDCKEVPVLFTSGKKEIIEQVRFLGLDRKYTGEFIPIIPYMRPDWLDY